MHGVSVLFATCRGHCARIFRPLACRIFPLVPDYRDGLLRIREDPRAALFCPLLSAHAVEARFADAVYRAISALLGDQAVRTMLTHYTAMLDEYRALCGRETPLDE